MLIDSLTELTTHLTTLNEKVEKSLADIREARHVNEQLEASQTKLDVREQTLVARERQVEEARAEVTRQSKIVGDKLLLLDKKEASLAAKLQDIVGREAIVENLEKESRSITKHLVLIEEEKKALAEKRVEIEIKEAELGRLKSILDQKSLADKERNRILDHKEKTLTQKQSEVDRILGAN